MPRNASAEAERPTVEKTKLDLGKRGNDKTATRNAFGIVRFACDLYLMGVLALAQIVA